MIRDPVRALRDETELEQILTAPRVVLCKHSPRCGISSAALLEVRHFAETHADVPVYMVNVITQQALSRTIADRLGVRHASPQAIVIRSGDAVWSASHFRVTAHAVEQAVASA